MKTQIRRDPGDRSGASCPSFTLETPEDYGLAVQRIGVLKARHRNDAQDAELKSLEDAVQAVDTCASSRTKNNQIG